MKYIQSKQTSSLPGNVKLQKTLRFEVLIAVTMKTTPFQDVMTYGAFT
jgi:hypothetical protein